MKFFRSRRMPVALGLAAVAAVVLVVVLHHDSGVPSSIRKQAEFGLFYPTKSTKGITVEGDTVKYAQQGPDKVFSFVIRDGDKRTTISEQAYPEILIYEKVTANFLNTREIGTKLGKVVVGNPRDQKGVVAAVIKVNDTLIFAKPAKPLTDDEWRNVFNVLENVH